MTGNDQHEDLVRRLCILTEEYLQQYAGRPYHNFHHAIDVAKDAYRIGKGEGCDEHGLFLLVSAGLVHDWYNTFGMAMMPGRKMTDEEQSAVMAERVLPCIGYGREDANRIARIVLATHQAYKPRDIEEKVIRDADLAGLGKATFFEDSENVRRELGVNDLHDWYARRVSFLEGHRWHTPTAERLYGPGKECNLEQSKARYLRYSDERAYLLEKDEVK